MMSNEATFNEFASRPKIHRLPSLPAPLPDADRRFMMRALWGCAAVVGVSIIGIMYQNTEKKPPLTAATPAPQVMTEEMELASSTIYIKGKEGVIVGQMAKIPQEPEKSTDIKDITPASQSAGRDLLQIISKY